MSPFVSQIVDLEPPNSSKVFVLNSLKNKEAPKRRHSVRRSRTMGVPERYDCVHDNSS